MGGTSRECQAVEQQQRMAVNSRKWMHKLILPCKYSLVNGRNQQPFKCQISSYLNGILLLLFIYLIYLSLFTKNSFE